VEPSSESSGNVALSGWKARREAERPGSDPDNEGRWQGWRRKATRRRVLLGLVMVTLLGGMWATGRLTLNPRWDRELDFHPTSIDPCSFLTAEEFRDTWEFAGSLADPDSRADFEARVTPFPETDECAYSVVPKTAGPGVMAYLGEPYIVVRAGSVDRLDWWTYLRYWDGDHANEDRSGYSGLDQVARMEDVADDHVVDVHKNGLVVRFRSNWTSHTEESRFVFDASDRVFRTAEQLAG
jgi:hypothetical protein